MGATNLVVGLSFFFKKNLLGVYMHHNTVDSAEMDHFGPRAFDPVSRKDTELYLKKVTALRVSVTVGIGSSTKSFSSSSSSFSSFSWRARSISTIASRSFVRAHFQPSLAKCGILV